MWNRLRTSVVVLAVFVPGLYAGAAQAREKPLTAAQANEEGKRRLKEGKVQEAVAIWRQGFFVATGEDEIKLAKNLGIAHYKLKDYENAHYFLSFFVEKCADAPERTRKSKTTLVKIAERLAPGRSSVTLRTDPADAVIHVGEKKEGNRYKAPLFRYFEPGEHTVVLEKEGRATVEKTFRTESGRPLVLTEKIPLETKVAGGDRGDGGTPIPVDPGVSKEVETDSWTAYWPWVSIGAGAALLATGGVYEYLAVDTNNDIADLCQGKYELYDETNGTEGWSWKDANTELNRRFDDEVVPKNAVAISMFIAGGTAVVLGAGWLLFGPDEPPKMGRARLTPVMMPAGGGVAVDIGF